MPIRRLQTRERILLHLFDYSRFAEEYEAPPDVTQEAIARAVDIRIQHVQQYVRPLVVKGLIQESVRHVKEAPTRRKVYFLTAPGRLQASSLRTTLFQEDVPVLTKAGTVHPAPLSKVYQESRRSSPLLELLREIRTLGYVRETPGTAAAGVVDDTQDAPRTDRFYGREKEVEEIGRALEQGPLVVVIGIAGIGKTALGAKVCDTLRGRRSLFWQQIRAWDTTMGLLARVASFAQSLDRVVLLNYLKGSGPKDLGRAEELLLADLSRVPATLIFDDVHDASEESRTFFEILQRTLKKAQGPSALLLSRTVPTFYSRKEVALEKSVVEFTLKGLSDGAGISVLRETGLSEAQAKRIVTSTGGSPLFLKLIASAGPEASFEVGWNTVEAYIAEQIEPSLSPEERESLEVASLYSLPVPPHCVLIGERTTSQVLISLEKKGLVDGVGSGRLALHDSLRDHFLRGLPQARRDALASFAVPRLMEAADAESEGGKPSAAIPYLENAVAIDPDPKRRVQNLRALGELRIYTGEDASAIEAFRAALRDAEDPDDRARLHNLLGLALGAQLRLDEADGEIELGLALLPSKPSVTAGWLLYRRAAVAIERKDYPRALADVERALSWIPALPEERRREDLQASLCMVRGFIHREDPARRDLALALMDLREALETYEGMGDRQGPAIAYTEIGKVLLRMGRVPESLEVLEKSAALAKEIGDAPTALEARMMKAKCLAEGLGDFEGAEAIYRDTFAESKALNLPMHMMSHFEHFADVLRLEGRVEEARESLEHFLQVSAHRTGSVDRVRSLCLAARLSALSGDVEAAGRHLREAETQAAQVGGGGASAYVEWARAVLESRESKVARAADAFGRALEASAQLDDPARAEFLLDYGTYLTKSGKKAEARQVLESACEAAVANGRRPIETAARTAIAGLPS